MKPNLFFRTMARHIAPLFVLLAACAAQARDVRTVEGHSRYVVPRTVSLEDAEAIALQRAITDALAAEFGTIVQSEVWTELYNSDDRSTAEAWQNGLNLVKGEWLETIGKPQIDLAVSSEGYVVEVRVRGRAAAIESGELDLRVAVRQVGEHGASDAARFASGNRLVVDFGSPVDGYLAIFLADAQSDVMQLLPFAGESVPAATVEGGRSYSFFADNSGPVEEQYSLYTDSDRERNILYVLFSTRPFTRPFAEISSGVRTIKAAEFRRWLTRQRTSDASMQTIITPIMITR